MRRLEGRVIVVTGGARGIGKATALRCAREGAKVAICDIVDDIGREVATSARKEGLTVNYYHMDVSNEKEVEETFKRIAAELGPITGLVNNAGIEDAKNDKLTHEGRLEVWEKILKVNLYGVLLCTKHAIPYMIKERKGAIVNIASIAALIGLPMVGYAASKGGILAVTRHDAISYAQHNIRVNAIAPGFINTELLQRIWKETPEKAEELRNSLPLRRLGEPEEVASAVAFLLSDDASYITGTCLVVDGGFTAK